VERKVRLSAASTRTDWSGGDAGVDRYFSACIIVLMLEARETETSRLLKKWHSGERAGLDGLLDRHLPWIRNHVRGRLGSLLRVKAETMDYVQDAMVQFLKYGPSILVAEDDHFRALFVRIVENSIRNQYDWFTAQRRAVSREKPLPPDTVLSIDRPVDRVVRPSQEAANNENEAWVRLGLELIDADDSKVLILRQWQDLSFAAIGERLDISAAAARMRHNRAVTRLAREVGKLRRGQIGGNDFGLSSGNSGKSL